MKKLLGISLVAVLAVSPLMANAAGADPTAATTSSEPYLGKAITDTDRQATASAAYVKGAYNAAIGAVNAVRGDTYTKNQVDQALNAKVDSAGNFTGENDSELIQNKTVVGAIKDIASAVDTLDANAVKSVVEGTTNGTVSVDGTDVAVHGLGSAAYTNSNAYATAAQGALADSAVQSVAEGSTNGTVSVDGTDVAVHGLGSAAYTDSSAYATAAQGTTADNAVQTVKVNGTALTEDENHNVNITVATGSTAGTISVNGADVAVNGAITSLAGYATETGVAATIKNTGITVNDNKTVSLSGGVTGTGAGTITIMTDWSDPTQVSTHNYIGGVSNTLTASLGGTITADINDATVSYSTTVNQ